MTAIDIERLEQLASAAHARWSDESLAEATSTSWGFFAYGDASPAIGGGVGGFVWLSSKSAVLKFIAEVLPFSPPGPSNRDHLAVADQVASVIAQLKNSEIDLEACRKKLNRVLRSFSQIEWIGTFKDLKGGQSPYARKLILGFRRENNLKVSTKPVAVARSEISDFKEYLSMCGI